MEAFVHVAELNSFSAAARRLGLSKSVVSKRVDQLETHLGVQLLRRTTRVVHTTEAGRRYHLFCRDILDQIAAADNALKREDDEPEGHLRISCPTALGSRIIGPIACDYQERYPRVRLSLLLLDRNPNPIEEGFDISIWDQPGARGNLAHRRLAPLNRVLVAAPDYLAKFEPITHPNQLYAHQTIHYQYLGEGRDWRLEHPRHGRSLARIQPSFVTNNGMLMRDVALAGKGIAILPMFLIERELATQKLAVVLPDWRPPAYHILALYAAGRQTATKTRCFLEMLQGAFQTQGAAALTSPRQKS
nr:LysR family transcriptional regulator [Acanthopleuribacter pedis]